MPPSFDFMASLFCAEEPTESIWDEDEVVSDNNDDAHNALLQDPSRISIPMYAVQDDEVVAVLVEKEIWHMPQQDYLHRFRTLHLDADSRWNAINWIFDVQVHYNFGPLTAYLAVNYLDRFLSSYQLPQGKAWMLQLLSVACLSLAAKMEEPEVPVLLDLQVGEVKYVFEARTIQRMELLILSVLTWRLSSVTPFSYVGCLLHKIGMSMPLPISLVKRVTELIMATCKVIEFLSHRPSVIAIASAICACEELFPVEAGRYKEDLLCALPVNHELSVNCYQQMQELVIDPFWTSKKVGSSGGSSISDSAPRSPVGVLDAAVACVSSIDSDGGKTRSLESNVVNLQWKGSITATVTRINKRKLAEL